MCRQLPRADLYVAAMGRSGSTLLANLLTTPPSRWVLVEPWFPMGASSPHLLQQMRRFGFEVADADWQRDRQAATAEARRFRLARLFGERLAGLERWGIKEIRPGLHEATVELIRPARVVLQVRDLRDVALSFVEKFARTPTTRYDHAWARHYIRIAAAALVRLRQRLPAERLRVVRYEQLVASPAERRALADWLDWLLDGEQDRNLDLFQRAYEIDRHGGALTETSVRRHEREPSDGDRAFADRVAGENTRYQAEFGYG